MERRYKTGMVMASTRSGGGVGLRGDGVDVLGYRGFLMVALLFVYCSITTDAVTSTQQTKVIATFNPGEVDALNAIFRIWSKNNPQLSTLLNWSLDKHPCDNLTTAYQKMTGTDEFPGSWSGVRCTSVLQNFTDIEEYYHISVTSLKILGSNSSCQEPRRNDDDPCGFDEIIGRLPLEISNLTNLQQLIIKENPRLTGPVPVELFHMPNLTVLDLCNNSLSGTLPSDVYNAGCKLQTLDLRYNDFSGSLRVSSQGTLFCSSLHRLDVGFNQLNGSLNLQNWNGRTTSLDFSNNYFRGTFSTGPYFDPQILDLSYNNFSNIQLTKYNGSKKFDSSQTLYMPSLSDLFISNNNFRGPFFEELFQLPSLSVLDISNNHFNGTFFIMAYLDSYFINISNNQFNDITSHVHNETTASNGNIFLPSLREIYFHNNNLSGQFPAEILTAPSLRILDASQNGYQTLQLPNLQSNNCKLLYVAITNNKLGKVNYSKSGPLSSYNLQIQNLLFIGGNLICNTIESRILSSICHLNETSKQQAVIPKPNTKMKAIIATSTSSTFVLVLLVTAIYVRRRLMGRVKALNIILEEFDKKEVKVNFYSYKEVKLATNNFDKDNKLGEGGFGVVYKGELSDGTQVAVKKLTMSSNQVLSEFLNEVIIISGLKHRNLVKLKGCCLGDGDQRILVFEYMENNNLAEALWMHGDLQSNVDPPSLDWKMRFNIIVSIARGLAYLHEELQPPIIHRDIKAANILLDKNYNAKIADFGLAYLFRVLDNEASHLTLMQVAGTRGYCSPEYAQLGHVSTALDVYSFGILVLEIVSGRKNIDFQKSSEEIYLPNWALKQYEARASRMLIDQKMEHSPLDLEAILRVIVVALACVDYKATRRPKMHDVVPMLFGNMPIKQFQTSFEDGDD